MLDTGQYYGHLLKAGVAAMDNEKRTPFMYLRFEVTHIADEEQWSDISPCTRDVLLYMSDAAWPFTEKKLEKISWNGNCDEPRFQQQLYDGIELSCKHNIKGYEEWSLTMLNSGDKEYQSVDREWTKTIEARFRQGQKPQSKPAKPQRPLVNTNQETEAVTDNGSTINNDPPF